MAVARAFFAQRQALMHPEAVLLVDDREREGCELDAFLEESVRTDHERHETLAHTLAHVASRLARLPPGRERDVDAEGLEPAAKVPGVLIREKLRRSHERDLTTCLDGAGRRKGRDEGLAAADIALHQPQHRLGDFQVRLDFLEHALLGRRRPKRQRGEEPAFERAGGDEGPSRILLNAPSQEFQGQLVRQELLECEPSLRRMASVEEQLDRCIGWRPMHVLQRLPQARQLRALEKRRGQPVREVLGGSLVEGRAHQLTEPSLSESLGPGVNRSQMLVGTHCFRDVGPAVFRMHDLEARRAATHFAEAADAHPSLEAFLLFRREVKEPQSEVARAVADPGQHLAAASKRDFSEQHFAFYRGTLARDDLAERHHASAVLVTQRQEKQEVLSSLDAEGAQPLSLPIADTAQRRHGLQVDHPDPPAITTLTGRRCTPLPPEHPAAGRRRRRRRGPDRARGNTPP